MKAPRLRIHSASLLYFDAVRRDRSIRAASRRLNVTASAINRQILDLEEEIGTPLFERLPSGMQLTAAGEFLARHVITVLRDAERFQLEVDALHGMQRGHVSILSLEGLCHHLIPETITAMNEKHPGITFSVGILKSEDIPHAITEGDAHLGIVFQMPERADLRHLASVRVPIGAAVSPRSPLANRPWITPNDLNDQAIILPKANFANRHQLQQAGLVIRSQYECGSIELMKQLVLRDQGIALMTRIGLEAELKSGSLVHIPIRNAMSYIYSELSLFSSINRSLPIAAEIYANFFCQTLDNAQK